VRCLYYVAVVNALMRSPSVREIGSSGPYSIQALDRMERAAKRVGIGGSAAALVPAVSLTLLRNALRLLTAICGERAPTSSDSLNWPVLARRTNRLSPRRGSINARGICGCSFAFLLSRQQGARGARSSGYYSDPQALGLKSSAPPGRGRVQLGSGERAPYISAMCGRARLRSIRSIPRFL
jgi:hypothetical protein